MLKQIWSNKSNIFFLKDFIESMLDIQIKEINIMPYLEKMAKYLPAKENFGIVNVRVKTISDEEINVGIQTIDGYYIQNKLLLYYAQIHENQLEYEQNKFKTTTITINLLDFDIIKENNDYYNIIKLQSKDCEFLMHTVELNKFRNSVKDIKNKKEAWIAYIANDDLLADVATKKYSTIKGFDNSVENYLLNEKME